MQTLSPLKTKMSEADQLAFIEEHIGVLETYFITHDDIGMMCNKDVVEDQFDRWLMDHDNSVLVAIIEATL